MNNLGIYIHYPFCVKKCPYCSFYSICHSKSTSDEYCKKIVELISNLNYDYDNVDTIYFGGGTPVLAGAKNISEIINALSKKFSINEAEITLEANPAYTLSDTLADFKSAGINRLSFGVQSLDDKCLSTLQRSHSSVEAIHTVENSLNYFDNVSVDIMLGVPHQTIADVNNFAKTFGNMGVKHISAYMLKIEKGTPFFANNIANICPDEDTVCDIYLETVDIMKENGFEQYEISNFAKKGFQSRHNNKYWLCEDYLGLGTSAHSCIGNERFAFDNDIKAFLSAENPTTLMRKTADGCDLEEFVMLRLRLTSGLSLKLVNELYPQADTNSFLARAKILQKQRLLNIKDDVISLNPKGFLVSNSVILYILYGI